MRKLLILSLVFSINASAADQQKDEATAKHTVMIGDTIKTLPESMEAVEIDDLIVLEMKPLSIKASDRSLVKTKETKEVEVERPRKTKLTESLSTAKLVEPVKASPSTESSQSEAAQ